MENLLDNWRRECYLLSSPFSLNKMFERTDVDIVYKILSGYFGVNYFIRTKLVSKSKSNWLHFLLANYKLPSSMASLFETANLLLYLETLTKSTQNKFKQLLKDHRQFRDMLFEIYVYRLLDFNNIKNTKKPMEGIKELDLLCELNGKEFLGECRKVYMPGVDYIEIVSFITQTILIKLKTLDRLIGMIGTIKFNDRNDLRLKDIFEKKISRFIEGFNMQMPISADYHDIDKINGNFSVVDFSEAESFIIEQKAEYDIMFKVKPTKNFSNDLSLNFIVDVKSTIHIPQNRINNKIVSIVNEKILQHSNSIHPNKIYFIDSETIPDLEFGIFHIDSMFEEENVERIIESISEGNIICFIRREFLNGLPKTSIRAFGKNIDGKIKHTLENLRTDFDYDISVKYW